MQIPGSKEVFVRISSIAICAIFVASTAYAQTDRGTITGTVADPTNAVIPSANIKLINTQTGAQYDTVTTDTGNYTLPSLPVGTYNLSVEVPGFKKFIQDGIKVATALTERVDVVLEIGSASEAVTITADAPLLQTENAAQSFFIPNERIDAIPFAPMYVRSPFVWVQLTPGTTNAGGGQPSSVKVNGSPTGTFRVLLDGQDVTSSISPDHTSEQQPGVEALSEMTLQSDNFSAEFGQIQGGLFNFTSKSGTNQVHGSAYDYIRNEDFNAALPYTHVSPEVRAEDWGFTMGGPLWIPKVYDGRNKTFLFFNWELYQTFAAASTWITLPTAAMRAGNFSSILTGRNLGTDVTGAAIMENTIYDPTTAHTVNGNSVTTPFPGNIIPTSRLDPTALKIQNLIPAPENSQNLLNWEETCVTPEHRRLPSFKVDQFMGPKSKLSFYWSMYDYESKGNPDCLPQPISGRKTRSIPTQTFRLTYDYTVTPTFLVHLGIGWNHYRSYQFPESFLSGYNAQQQLGLVGSAGPGFPAIYFGAAAFGGSSVNIGGFNSGDTQTQDTPKAVASATWVRGNHTYKAGGEFRIDGWIDAQITGVMGAWTFSNNETALPYLATGTINGGSIGYGYASFLLGQADSAEVQPPREPGLRKNSVGVYVQDTWKITHKLTLDYGLRYDYQQPYREIYNRMGWFAPSVPNPSAGGLLGAMQYSGDGPGECHCRMANTYPYAFGPRLGIAWQVIPKTVVRAGWGISYGTTPPSSYLSSGVGVGWNNYIVSAASFGVSPVQFSQGLVYPASALVGPLNSPGLYPNPGQIGPNPSWFDPNGGRPPRINQWTISIQRQVTSAMSVEAAYVGNHAVWIQATTLENLNALTPQKIAAVGLNLNSPTDLSLLTSTFASGLPEARGFQVPYAGFPTGQTLAQALRPYPQFGTIPVMWDPLGDTWYNALQAKITQRTWHGLTTSTAFTWGRNFELGAEGNTGGGDAVNDVYNRANQRTISSYDQPLILDEGFNYRLPRVGPNALVRNVVRDWTIGGVLTYANGLPIAVPTAQNNLGNVLFQNTNFSRIPGVPLWTKNPDCGCINPNADFALNPAAWAEPAPGQWGTSALYYNDYRAPRHPSENLSLGRLFHIRESVTFEVRMEFVNALNRLELPAPTSSNALATQTRNAAGVPTGGFGYINASSIGGIFGPNRTAQLLGRLQW
jgi:hypothetical protein